MLTKEFQEILVEVMSKHSVRILTTDQLIQFIHNLEYAVGRGCGDVVKRDGESVVMDLLKSRYSSDEELVIFDVGACEGEYTDMVLETITRCTVHAFEPDRHNYDKITTKYTDNNVICNYKAAYKQNCVKKVYGTDKAHCLSSLNKDRDFSHVGIPTVALNDVECIKLDDYCKSNSISYVHLLKMDVEGTELDVMLGAEGIIKSTGIVQFEFGGANIDSKVSFKDLFYYFNKRGFLLYRILPVSKFYPVKKYTEIDENYITANYIATREVIPDEFIDSVDEKISAIALQELIAFIKGLNHA